MKKSQFLEKLDREWQDLKAAYANLSEAALLEPGVTGEWSIKDIIAHVTTWEEQSLTYLPLILTGRRPPRYSTLYGGIDAFNALMSEKKGKLALAEVLRQRDEIHQQLVEYIQSLPEEQFTGNARFIRRLRLDTTSHYPIHAAAIRTQHEHHSTG
jgi:hypothetical protein